MGTSCGKTTNFARQFGTKPLFLDIKTPSALETTARVLEEGGVVALPTDTVYGLISLQRYSDRLFQIKQRDTHKPLGFFVKDANDVYNYAENTVDPALLHQLLPGCVTLLLKKLPTFARKHESENDLIGLRVPDDQFVQELAAQFNEPIAQTSANLSGNPSSLDPNEFEELWEKLDIVLTRSTNDVSNKSREGSTIIDLSKKGIYTIVRDGRIKEHCEMILQENGLRPK